ncbi:hypothetical protein WMY93_030576 [Mugilogobius chulae]|uniref:Ig-like domain-containing protein n=1 Tax=Mugilogobius chulae TaxID=88201 RepID=A0AAW0MD77_9GOBI
MLFLILSFVAHAWSISAAAGDILVITSDADRDVALNCTTIMKAGVQYYAVRWYKESVDPRLTGLVSKTLPNGTMRWYVGADTRISLQKDTLNLQLPTVTCSDQGVYQCYLAAPVGEQNREGRVRLTVTGCPTVKAPETKKPVVETEKHLERIPLEEQNPTLFLVTCGAVGIICALFVLMVVFMCCKCLRNSLWIQTKTPGKNPFPDPNCVPEKQDLLWIYSLDLPPKKAQITAA